MPEKEPGKSQRSSRPASGPASSDDFPVTSSYTGHHPGALGYVELVADIQNRLGRLTEAVETLKEQSKEHGTELRGIGKDLHAAKMVGGLLVLAASAVGWVIHEVVQYLSAHAK